MKNVKMICLMAMGIALYVVLGMSVKIPLIGHIQTDLGYVAFGAFLSLYGVPAVAVGVIGCLFESLIVSGWVPVGWMLGQAFIAIALGTFLKKSNGLNRKNLFICIFLTVFSMFIGIGVIKTIVECNLYGIPFEVKFIKNLIATVADIVPMIAGILLADRLRKVACKCQE